jgi:hypothetical protein
MGNGKFVKKNKKNIFTHPPPIFISSIIVTADKKIGFRAFESAGANVSAANENSRHLLRRVAEHSFLNNALRTTYF